MSQNLGDLLSNLDKGGNEMGEKEGSTEEKVKGGALKRLKDELTDMYECQVLRSMLGEGTVQAPQVLQPTAPAATAEPGVGLKMSLDLADMFKAMVEANKSAMEAKDAATGKYFEAMQGWLEAQYKNLSDARDRWATGQATAGAQVQSPIEVWKEVNTAMQQFREQMGLGVPAAGVDTGTMIQLKRMEQQHELEMERLRGERMERDIELKMQLQRHGMEIAEHRQQQERGQNMWERFWDSMGQAVEAGAKQGMEERRHVGTTAGGVEVINCRGTLPSGAACRFPLPVPPDAEQVNCPRCGETWDVKVTED